MTEKPLDWIASSKEDLLALPADVIDVFGYALHLAQNGGKHDQAKPLKGANDFKGGGVMEVVEDYDGDTYRAVYTVKFPDRVYVLDAFQKKSTRGIATPKVDIERIKTRFKAAKADYEARNRKKK